MSLMMVKETTEMVETLLTKKPKKNTRKSTKSAVNKAKTSKGAKGIKQDELELLTHAQELPPLQHGIDEPTSVPVPPAEMKGEGELDALLGPEQFLTPEQEREIIRRVQEGDREAFEELVNAYKRKAYYTAMSFVNNHEDALDLSQDAFVKAFKAIKTFDLNSPFFPWFYKIIKNHCLNYIKKSSRMRNDSIDELEEEQYMQFREHRPNPREQFEQNQQREQLWEAINRLKPDFREIIIMKHFHNHSYKEIADALNIPIGTVMSRLFNARQELREKYLEVIGEKN